MVGAISRTSGVGVMKNRIKTFGISMLSAVHRILNTATVPSAYFRVSCILSP